MRMSRTERTRNERGETPSVGCADSSLRETPSVGCADSSLRETPSVGCADSSLREGA